MSNVVEFDNPIDLGTAGQHLGNQTSADISLTSREDDEPFSTPFVPKQYDGMTVVYNSFPPCTISEQGGVYSPSPVSCSTNTSANASAVSGRAADLYPSRNTLNSPSISAFERITTTESLDGQPRSTGGRYVRGRRRSRSIGSSDEIERPKRSLSEAFRLVSFRRKTNKSNVRILAKTRRRTLSDSANTADIPIKKEKVRSRRKQPQQFQQWAQIPDAVQVVIANFLSIRELLALSETSTAMRAMSHSDIIWRDLYCNRFSTLQPSKHFYYAYRSRHLRPLPGDRIEAAWAGAFNLVDNTRLRMYRGCAWWSGTIVSRDGDCFRVHYDMWDESTWDEWLPRNRIRWPVEPDTIEERLHRGDIVELRCPSSFGRSPWLVSRIRKCREDNTYLLGKEFRHEEYIPRSWLRLVRSSKSNSRISRLIPRRKAYSPFAPVQAAAPTATAHTPCSIL